MHRDNKECLVHMLSYWKSMAVSLIISFVPRPLCTFHFQLATCMAQCILS